MSSENERKFEPIFVKADSRRYPAPGDFNTELSQDKKTLFVPSDLADKVGLRMGFRTADVLLSYLHAFPSSFAKGLGWTMEEVREATAKVVALLEGLVPESRLRPGPPRKFAFGALPPPEHPVQDGYVVGDDDPHRDHGNGD